MTVDVDDLDDLDPDDTRPVSEQLTSLLRAAILTRKFEPGDRLPSQPALAQRYGVARETVKRSLEPLQSERLIISRQGSGAYVRAQTQKPVGLRPHIEAAFERENVTIDFAGFSGETLNNTIAEILDKVRAGRLTPQTLAVRILLSDTTVPLALPRRSDTDDDDPAVRKRSGRITRRAVEGIVEAVAELEDLGLLKSAKAEVRVHSASPLFKLYIINGEEAFFGFYPVLEHTVTIDKKPVPIFDPMGKDAALFHFSVTDDSGLPGKGYVEEAQTWFNSVWETISREYAE
jgi:DNA-binding transcriptional regulator YhcF (GntR family)